MFAPEETQWERIRDRMIQAGFDLDKFSWDHLLLAGGFLAGIRLQDYDSQLYRDSDLDFFVYELASVDAGACQVIAQFIQSLGAESVKVSGNVSTFKTKDIKVQLVFPQYQKSKSIDEILSDIDMIHLQYGYDGAEFHDYTGDYGVTGISKIQNPITIHRYLKNVRRGFQLPVTDEIVVVTEPAQEYGSYYRGDHDDLEELESVLELSQELLEERERESISRFSTEHRCLSLYKLEKGMLNVFRSDCTPRAYLWWQVLTILHLGPGASHHVDLLNPLHPETGLWIMKYVPSSHFIVEVDGTKPYHTESITKMELCGCDVFFNPSITSNDHRITLGGDIYESLESESWVDVVGHLLTDPMTDEELSALTYDILTKGIAPLPVVTVLIGRIITARSKSEYPLILISGSYHTHIVIWKGEHDYDVAVAHDYDVMKTFKMLTCYVMPKGRYSQVHRDAIVHLYPHNEELVHAGKRYHIYLSGHKCYKMMANAFASKAIENTSKSAKSAIV